MNASVLIVGDQEFSTGLYKKVRGLSAMTTWQVDTASSATKLVEAERPEILLLQAIQTDNWELCRTLKQHRHSMWSYCVLVDERSCSPENGLDETLTRQMSLTTTALEIGADAYLWIPDRLLRSPDAETANYISCLIQAHIRTAMRRSQAYQELSQANDLLSALALVDPLTQLGNRRAFDWELPRQIEVAQKQNLPLSLLIMDIDYFKSVNDNHGHLVGDQVLQMFAERLRHHMRFSETPFRYGGEEFVVVLQNSSLQEAKKTAERLRRLVDDTPFVIDQDLDLPLTVSIGVATLKSADDAAGIDLIARADDNLLKAKGSGRNQVIV